MYAMVIEALWFILPAYLANSLPVDVSQIKFLKKFGKPIDFGRSWRGVRLLGDGKTWRGFFAGLIGGTIAGAIQEGMHEQMQSFLQEHFIEIVLPQMSIPLAFMLSLGALVGDMVASFMKRRMNLKRGAPAPLLDQLDFVFGAFLFAWVYNCVTLNRWENVFNETIGYRLFFVIIIITPVVHMIGNLIAWAWRLKKQPW